ncbi:aspartate/glutamate racemase family protein [Allorhizobium sp. BGMRC 0089]|uniref:aspartate/glutamate racemase family protein n=1 Tax=Allorhizobium sonneratiae TaxID=2934936 RepID=UPI002033B66A|nr:aspartate/glutamate racemase family protein [Allorhizobium sonneratiae]MCM2292791.1 aspartate/glutamate racemase family protein [Allorhizobium sonneratiae]
MRMIGLIGGMSFESSAVYYRLINEAVRKQCGGLSSADLVMRSVNFAEIVALQKAGRWDLAEKALGDAAAALERAGADCVLICTNTMHLIADAVAKRVRVPLIHIVDETAAAIKQAGYARPLLLATKYTMEHGFYTDRMRGLGLDPMVPDAADRQMVHDVIFNELCAGEIKDTSRDAFLTVIDKAKAEGADCVILGCTEICLLLDPNALVLPGFDSTTIHCQAAVEFSLSQTALKKSA